MHSAENIPDGNNEIVIKCGNQNVNFKKPKEGENVYITNSYDGNGIIDVNTISELSPNDFIVNAGNTGYSLGGGGLNDACQTVNNKFGNGKSKPDEIGVGYINNNGNGCFVQTFKNKQDPQKVLHMLYAIGPNAKEFNEGNQEENKRNFVLELIKTNAAIFKTAIEHNSKSKNNQDKINNLLYAGISDSIFSPKNAADIKNNDSSIAVDINAKMCKLYEKKLADAGIKLIINFS